MKQGAHSVVENACSMFPTACVQWWQGYDNVHGAFPDPKCAHLWALDDGYCTKRDQCTEQSIYDCIDSRLQPYQTAKAWHLLSVLIGRMQCRQLSRPVTTPVCQGI